MHSEFSTESKDRVQTSEVDVNTSGNGSFMKYRVLKQISLVCAWICLVSIGKIKLFSISRFPSFVWVSGKETISYIFLNLDGLPI